MTQLVRAMQELGLEGKVELSGRWVKLQGEWCVVYVAETGLDSREAIAPFQAIQPCCYSLTLSMLDTGESVCHLSDTSSCIRASCRVLEGKS